MPKPGKLAAPLMGAAGAARARPRRGADPLAVRLAAIPSLPRSALVQQWTAAYGRPPPKGLSRRLLEHAAAYHLQAKASGGLKPAVRRMLAAAASEGPGVVAPPTTSPLAPGSRLVRHWQGRSYTVEILDQGFLCQGRRYASLSAVARSITGTRWSGPRFFGL